jgi:hypothetical protein
MAMGERPWSLVSWVLLRLLLASEASGDGRSSEVVWWRSEEDGVEPIWGYLA